MKLNMINSIFIFVIVSSLSTIVDAHGGCYWCWRSRSHCQKESTLTIVSSECSRPLTGVRIYSRNYMVIVSSYNGRYRIKTCSLPLYVTLQKYGFRTMRVIVRRSAEKFTMRCLGSEGKTVYATVRSDCTGPLEGVKFTSTELIGVTSNLPGSYRLRVCTLPTDITSKKHGYAPVTQRVTQTSLSIQMTCPASTCDTIQKTISIVSSDCSTPLSDVTITSQHQPISVRSLAAGSYELDLCSLPVIVSLARSGFKSIRVKLTTSSNAIRLPCLGTRCTSETATVTITSDCTPVVLGVKVTSAQSIEVSTSAPGTYEVIACSSPVTITCERTGYTSATLAVTSSPTTVSLTCIVPPIIIEDPQSKYRDIGDDVKLCCQAGPTSSSFSYKWFKDGTELLGETNNELTLNSLTASDDGRYKCLAKSTASDTLPAAVSAEAQLSVTENPEDYTDALVSHIVYFPPGCSVNVKRCVPRPCRTAPESTLSCADDMVVCAVTETRQEECAGVNIPVTFVTECSCSCTAPTVLINGKVIGSDTGGPLEGISVILNGQTDNYFTDANGDFSFSVSSTVRRLVLKATDSNNNYNDAFQVSDIIVGYTDPISVAIVMVRRAPFIQIDPTQENELAISSSPSEQGTGVASISIPANAFFTLDRTPYTEQVLVSLTFLDPLDPDMLAIMPGRFVTLNANGEETILVTQGVFSLSSEDNAGNELLINGEIDVSGTPGFALWELDPLTASWIELEVTPGRKRRQVTQQQYLGSFNPQSVSWLNIDRVLSEPDCFFKVRVFQDNIAPPNEILSGLSFVLEVSQLLATGTEVVKYYSPPRSSPCISIKCPAAIAQATIRILGLETVYGVLGIEVSVLPANISEYSTDIRSVLEGTPYFYSLLQNGTDTIFINTPLNESGPFYLTEETCLNASIDDSAFWFTKDTTSVEDDFDDNFEGRCVAKITVTYAESAMMNASEFSSNNVTAISTWDDNKYSLRTAEMNFVGVDTILRYVYESCIEYRCSRENGTINDTTRVVPGVTNVTACSYIHGGGNVLKKRYSDPYGANFIAPILDPTDLPSGFFFTNTTNAQPAISDCLSSANNYTGGIFCGFAIP